MRNSIILFFILTLLGCKADELEIFTNDHLNNLVENFVTENNKKAKDDGDIIPPAYSILIDGVDKECKISIIQDLEIDSSKSIGFFVYADVPMAIYRYSDRCNDLLRLERLSDNWDILEDDLLSGALLSPFEPKVLSLIVRNDGTISVERDRN